MKHWERLNSKWLQPKRLQWQQNELTAKKEDFVNTLKAAGEMLGLQVNLLNHLCCSRSEEKDGNRSTFCCIYLLTVIKGPKDKMRLFLFKPAHQGKGCFGWTPLAFSKYRCSVRAFFLLPYRSYSGILSLKPSGRKWQTAACCKLQAASLHPAETLWFSICVRVTGDGASLLSEAQQGRVWRGAQSVYDAVSVNILKCPFWVLLFQQKKK